MSYVYFIKPVGQDGPIKIGQSRFPESRLRQLRSDLRMELELLAVAPGDFTVERNLHIKFREENTSPPFSAGRPYSVGGPTEWFTASERLIAYIANVRETGIILLEDQERHELRFAQRYLAGETLQAIGDDFGITRERVHQVLRHNGVPSLGFRPSTMRKAVSVETEALIVEMASVGAACSEIARKLDLNAQIVARYMRKSGFTGRRAKTPLKDGTLAKARQIAIDYQAGMKTSEIAQRHGMQQPTIYRFLRIAGVQPGRQSEIETVPSHLVHEYERGASARFLARKLGVDPRKVRDMLKNQGVKVRDHSTSVSVGNHQRRCGAIVSRSAAA